MYDFQQQEQSKMVISNWRFQNQEILELKYLRIDLTENNKHVIEIQSLFQKRKSDLWAEQSIKKQDKIVRNKKNKCWNFL